MSELQRHRLAIRLSIRQETVDDLKPAKLGGSSPACTESNRLMQYIMHTQVSSLQEPGLTFGKHAAIIDADIGIAGCNCQLMGSGLQIVKQSFQTRMAGDTFFLVRCCMPVACLMIRAVAHGPV